MPTKSLTAFIIPLLSAGLAFLSGAVIIKVSGADPAEAFTSLLSGAFGDLDSISRTLEKATPLIFNGLAIALALKAGLFNIGAQGQFLFGAIAAAAAGFGINGLPLYLHMPLVLCMGITAGCAYGVIQGALKAYTGAHEVITGIMLNYVAINITDYLTKGPFMDTSPGNVIPRTPLIAESCRLPEIGSLPWGFFIAVGCSVVVWWLISFTVKGFEIRATGANPNAARYAGMKPGNIIILTMGISGALAGIGGAVETMGVVHRYQPGFNAGLGFEGITIALLGRIHPFGVIPAAILVGAMKSGASLMQFNADVSTEIIDVIQALILFFVAADVIVRKFIPGADKTPAITLGTGWGKA